MGKIAWFKKSLKIEKAGFVKSFFIFQLKIIPKILSGKILSYKQSAQDTLEAKAPQNFVLKTNLKKLKLNKTVFLKIKKNEASRVLVKFSILQDYGARAQVTIVKQSQKPDYGCHTLAFYYLILSYLIWRTLVTLW